MRQQKSPRQRAEEQLAVANRNVLRLDRKRDALQEQLVHVTNDLEAALARRDYLKKHPDLSGPATTTGDTPA